MVKKGLMLHLWRVQQSATLVNIFMWALTLTATLFKNYVNPHFVRYGIIQEGQYLLGMTYLFLVIVFGVLAFGWVYDRVLQLWKEQAIVGVERNPYMQGMQNPKEIINWETYQIPMMRKLGLEWEADFNQRWNYRSLRMDPWLRKEVIRMVRTFRDSPLPAPDDRFVASIIFEKEGRWPDGRPLVTPKGFHHCTSCRLFVEKPKYEGRFKCPKCGSAQTCKEHRPTEEAKGKGNSKGGAKGYGEKKGNNGTRGVHKSPDAGKAGRT